MPPELFVAPAKSSEIWRTLTTLSEARQDYIDSSSLLDLVAVSSVVLGALASAPLLTVDEAAVFLGPFVQRDKHYVRMSVAHHALASIPAERRLVLQDLMRVLSIVDRRSEICSAANLAKAVGPILFRPERQSISKSADALTVGSIACTRMFIE